MEIYASIDLMEGKIVRLIRGMPENVIFYDQSPVETALKLQDYGVDGLHIVDLDAALGKGNNLKIIYEISKNVNIPIQVAGGIRSVDKAKEILKFADRVVLGTLLYTKEVNYSEILELGEKRIVVAIDYKNGKVNVEGWKKELELNLNEAILRFWNIGFRLFMVTNIANDGTLKGLDFTELASINKSYINHIYIAGGTRSMEDLIKAKSLGFRGVIIGRAIYEGKIKKEDILNFKK
jgi:phosphoribosylformimino-5-aminoimidazole carboxamide ribotide isomerase